MEFLLGIACGIALSLFFSFGATFFSQLQTSIHLGYRRAVPFAFGVSTGDVIVVFLMLTILKDTDILALLHNIYVASIGGAVLIAYGIFTFRSRTRHVGEKDSKVKFRCDDVPRRRYVFLKGFAINFLNPFIWIYWISVVALLSGELELTVSQRYSFFIGLLATTLSLDILKCKLASLLQRVITAKVMNICNKITGLILIAFGVYLISAMVVYQVSPKAREREEETKKQPTEMIKKIHDGVQNSRVGDSNFLRGHHNDTVVPEGTLQL